MLKIDLMNILLSDENDSPFHPTDRLSTDR